VVVKTGVSLQHANLHVEGLSALNPLNRANADSKLRGNLPNTAARLPNSLLQTGVNWRPTEDRSGRSSASETRTNPLRDHRPLKFREHAEHLDPRQS